MEVIRDANGNVIRRSRNLAGIQRYVGKNAIKTLAVDVVGSGEGRLAILFEDGASFETEFACFVALMSFVRRWRNVYGAPLTMQGQACGLVSHDNPELEE